MVDKRDPPTGKIYLKQKRPRSGVSLACLVSRRRAPHPCWSGSASGSREFAASKEVEDRNELKDEKTLLSGSLYGFSIGAKAQSRRKG